MSFFSFQDYPKALADFRPAIVVAQWHGQLTAKMTELAIKSLKKCKIPSENIAIYEVPGAFEIPFACKSLEEKELFTGILTFGAIIRGETPHFEYVAKECTRGIMELNLAGAIPIIMGVLTCDNEDQALARLGNATDLAKALVKQMNFVYELNN
jgi:6,7-dimethyl-8-ribityllumazine synthase